MKNALKFATYNALIIFVVTFVGVSLQDDGTSLAILAVPLLTFWVFVCSFATNLILRRTRFKDNIIARFVVTIIAILLIVWPL